MTLSNLMFKISEDYKSKAQADTGFITAPSPRRMFESHTFDALLAKVSLAFLFISNFTFPSRKVLCL